MTGAEHYLEAQRLLMEAANEADEKDPTGLPYLARAQTHATLALAAAVALSQSGQMLVRDCKEWEIAASAHSSSGVLR